VIRKTGLGTPRVHRWECVDSVDHVVADLSPVDQAQKLFGRYLEAACCF
jgi:hypothetical protein